jgi:hypothetical protein
MDGELEMLHQSCCAAPPVPQLSADAPLAPCHAHCYSQRRCLSRRCSPAPLWPSCYLQAWGRTQVRDCLPAGDCHPVSAVMPS